MAAVQSSMQALGGAAPDFELPDVTHANQLIRLSQLRGKALLVMFICNHCPYVIHLIKPLAALANEYRRLGFEVIAISSNDIENYPQDAPEPMREFAMTHNFEFPYLYDETQEVARAFGAECTPDFFVFDRRHLLRYRGQMDSSRPGNSQVAEGDDLSAAMTAVLAGESVSREQTPSIGCSIKWKAKS